MDNNIKFQIISDVHLEFYTDDPYDLPYPSKSSDYLLLAGDIGNPYRKNYEFYLNFCSNIYKGIYLITGNHEYYALDIKEEDIKNINQTDYYINELCKKWDNIYFLQRTTKILEINNTKIAILGCTLWTNIPYDKELIVELEMNDYNMIYKDPKLNISASDTTKKHNEDLIWLNKELIILDSRQDINSIIILTHHAPSFDMTNSKYKDDPINFAYATNLEKLIEKYNKIKYWVNGHTHITKIIILNNNARLVSNCMGYPNQLTNYNTKCYISL